MKKYLFLLALFVSAILFPDIARAADTLTDEITASALGISSTTYTAFEKKSVSGGSGAEYTGKAACQSSKYLSFKNGSGNGIWVSKSPDGYRLKSITCTYYTGTETVSLYAGTSNYPSTYDTDNTKAPTEGKLLEKQKANFTYEFKNGETAFCLYTDGTTAKTSQWSSISVTWEPIPVATAPSITSIVYGSNEYTSAPTDDVHIDEGASVDVNTANATSVKYRIVPDVEPETKTYSTAAVSNNVATVTISSVGKYEFIAVDDDSNESDPFTITFVKNVNMPGTPVLKIGDEDYTGKTYEGYWGTEVSIQSDYATDFYCGDEKLESSVFTLPDVASQTEYSFKAKNANGESSSVTLTFAPKTPADLKVLYDGAAITDENLEVISGTVLTLTATGASSFTANGEALSANDEGAYTYTVNTFGEVTFAAVNAAGTLSQTIEFTESTAKVYKGSDAKVRG